MRHSVKIATKIVEEQWGYMRRWNKPYARDFLYQMIEKIAGYIEAELIDMEINSLPEVDKKTV